MSLDAGGGPSRSGSGQDLWPKWMWIAVPVLVVVVVAGLWWALLSPPDTSTPTPTPTPTQRIITTQPTQGPTVQSTVATGGETLPTVALLPEILPTFTPTIVSPVATPTGQPTEAPPDELAIGVTATSTAGSGLNIRAGAGTGQPRVKTLPMGSIVEIIGGPKEANGYVWWEIRDEAGITGWAVSEFLQIKR